MVFEPGTGFAKFWKSPVAGWALPPISTRPVSERALAAPAEGNLRPRPVPNWLNPPLVFGDVLSRSAISALTVVPGSGPGTVIKPLGPSMTLLIPLIVDVPLLANGGARAEPL